MSESDSKQVPWGSCEKNFENIVIRTWPRYSSMNIVCGHGKIVSGMCTHCGRRPNVCVYIMWCFFPYMQPHVRCIMYCHVPGTPAHGGGPCMTWYCISRCERHVAMCHQHIVRRPCFRMTKHATRVGSGDCSLWMQHVNVLPVLKHGLRSLILMLALDTSKIFS